MTSADAVHHAFRPSRRALLLGAGALVLAGRHASAQSASKSFDAWIEEFRGRARAKGISDAVYDRVTRGLEPDTSVYAKDSAQPEFNEQLWQYLNRRISEWRLVTGQAAAKKNAALLKSLHGDFGIEPDVLLGLWGMESAFGELVDDPDHMKPVFPALAALAWGEPRRRKYWETEFLKSGKTSVSSWILQGR